MQNDAVPPAGEDPVRRLIDEAPSPGHRFRFQVRHWAGLAVLAAAVGAAAFIVPPMITTADTTEPSLAREELPMTGAASLPPAPPSVTPAATTTAPGPAPTVTKAAKPRATTATTKAATPTRPVRKQPAVKAESVARVSDPYFLYNYATRNCADIAGTGAGTRRGPIHQNSCTRTGPDNQEFVFVPAGQDNLGYQLYWIRNDVDGFCFDPPGTYTVELNTALIENLCHDQDNQYFRLEPSFVRDGWQYYLLRNTVTNYCLDVPGEATATGRAVLQVSQCLVGDDQDWALVSKSEW